MKARDLSITMVPGVCRALDLFMILRASCFSAFLSISSAGTLVQPLTTSCLIYHNSFLTGLSNYNSLPLPIHLKYLLYVSSLYSVTLCSSPQV